MKNSMVKMIKKVTATILAAATVMGATVAATPSMVRADDFKGIKLEELPAQPTADMDINVIKNAYKVGGNLGTNVQSGAVVYIDNTGVTGLDISAPRGSDIVVVYRTYTVTSLIGNKHTKVNCKSLVDGETFEGLTLDDNFARVFEINKAQNLNEAGIKVDEKGLQSYYQDLKDLWTDFTDWLF